MKIPKFSLNQMESGEINIIPVIDINELKEKTEKIKYLFCF